ncbi:MAG TPA: DNA/RNA non-specific endonuclease [Azospirillum sp.]|nr:DNA/RNA non-specific endonuclease [Azospirillum sp.]
MLRLLAFAVALLTAPVAAPAAPTACPEHFRAGKAPEIVNPRLAAQTQKLCYAGFAVLHSGITRTPLYAAEHLTRERVQAARGLERDSSFHPDPNLPKADRAELSDYARSGFDRGHMAPSGDMPDPQSQSESFSLANIIPQNPENNRDLWSDIEAAVRNLARRQGELYVVTGPIYQGERLQRLKGRVLVPTHVFKAVYDPKTGEAGAYLVPNAEGDAWTPLSITQLQEITGINVFPSLPRPVKDVAMALPDPASQGRRPRPRAGEPGGQPEVGERTQR